MTLSVSEEDTCYYINSNTFILWVANIKKYFKVDLILRFMLSTMLHGVIKVILIVRFQYLTIITMKNAQTTLNF